MGGLSHDRSGHEKAVERCKGISKTYKRSQKKRPNLRMAFTFIIRKGIYTEYHEWAREMMLRRLVSSL